MSFIRANLKKAKHKLKGTSHAIDPQNRVDEPFLKSAYNIILDRNPDPESVNQHRSRSSHSNYHKQGLLQELVGSSEFSRRIKNFEFENLSTGLSAGDEQDIESFVRSAYLLILRREVDESGFESAVSGIKSRQFDKDEFLNKLVASEEFLSRVQFRSLGPSLHHSRATFVRSFPKAKQILDIGGGSVGEVAGGMYSLGYPYHFDLLTIIDLPPEDRHDLYKNISNEAGTTTDRGVVKYLYQSMVDFTGVEDNSLDLVYSGQSIEHITEAEAEIVLGNVMRALKPGGHFCLDTPNRAITELQGGGFIDPEHKIEYTHELLSSKLKKAGFKILEAKGLNYGPDFRAKGKFSEEEISHHTGMFSEIEDCYLLAYVCQKP